MTDPLSLTQKGMQIMKTITLLPASAVSPEVLVKMYKLTHRLPIISRAVV